MNHYLHNWLFKFKPIKLSLLLFFVLDKSTKLPKEKVSFENTTSYRDIIESVRIELKTKDDNNFNLFHSQINENNFNINIIEEKEKNLIKEEKNDENINNVSNKGKNYLNEEEIDKDNYNINENKKNIIHLIGMNTVMKI